MPKFRTQYEHTPSPYQEPGSRVKILYGPIFDKQGTMSLKEIGKENLYDYIQSHADSVDINIILKRFEQGDISVLSRVQGAYGDFTQMPQTFAEALNTLIAAEQYFNGLPLETRAKFEHNFNKFIASMDSPTFSADMGIVPPDPTPSNPAMPVSPAGEAPADGGTPPATPSAPSSPSAPTT